MALRSAGSGKVSRDPVHHPLFARYYARLSVAAETRMGMAGVRERLLAGLSGRVIEIGAGNGLNFSHYPGTVSEVVAIEPERRLRLTDYGWAARNTHLRNDPCTKFYRSKLALGR